MRVLFEKRKISSITLSGAILTFLISLIIIVGCKERSYALLLVVLPFASIAILHIWSYLLKLSKYNSRFMELTEEKLLIESVGEGLIVIELENVLEASMDSNQIEIKVNHKINKKKGIFQYYMVQYEDVYYVPVLGDTQKIEQLLAVIGKPKSENTRTAELIDTQSMCRSYLCILVGAVCAFAISTFWNAALWSNLVVFACLLVILYFMHRKMHAPLDAHDASIYLLIRCIFESSAIAQYILCACKIEEFIKNTSLELNCSGQLVIWTVIVYVIVCILYLPKNGLGNRFMRFCMRRKIR